MITPDLKPCPNCNTNPDMQCNSPAAWVECEVCYMRGPRCYGEASAAAKWNALPQPKRCCRRDHDGDGNCDRHFDLSEFKPTAAHINALPTPLRKYIHDLHTRCDPAGEVADLALARDDNKSLRAKAVELCAQIGQLNQKLSLAHSQNNRLGTKIADLCAELDVWRCATGRRSPAEAKTRMEAFANRLAEVRAECNKVAVDRDGATKRYASLSTDFDVVVERSREVANELDTLRVGVARIRQGYEDKVTGWCNEYENAVSGRDMYYRQLGDWQRWAADLLNRHRLQCYRGGLYSSDRMRDLLCSLLDVMTAHLSDDAARSVAATVHNYVDTPKTHSAKGTVYARAREAQYVRDHQDWQQRRWASYGSPRKA